MKIVEPNSEVRFILERIGPSESSDGLHYPSLLVQISEAALASRLHSGRWKRIEMEMEMDDQMHKFSETFI